MEAQKGKKVWRLLHSYALYRFGKIVPGTPDDSRGTLCYAMSTTDLQSQMNIDSPEDNFFTSFRTSHILHLARILYAVALPSTFRSNEMILLSELVGPCCSWLPSTETVEKMEGLPMASESSALAKAQAKAEV